MNIFVLCLFKRYVCVNGALCSEKAHLNLSHFPLTEQSALSDSSDESVFVQAPKRHPLLSSKYTKVKPALLISMILENDTKHTPEQFKAKKAPPREGISHLLS